LYSFCFAGTGSDSNRSTQATKDLSSSNRGRLLNKDDLEALMTPNPWCLMESWSYCVGGWVLGRMMCNPLLFESKTVWNQNLFEKDCFMKKWKDKNQSVVYHLEFF